MIKAALSILTILTISNYALADGPPGVCTISVECNYIYVYLNGTSIQSFQYNPGKNCQDTDNTSRNAAISSADASAKKMQAGGVCVYIGKVNN